MGLQIFHEVYGLADRCLGDRSSALVRKVDDQRQGRNKAAVFRQVAFKRWYQAAAADERLQIRAPFVKNALRAAVEPKEWQILVSIRLGSRSVWR